MSLTASVAGPAAWRRSPRAEGRQRRADDDRGHQSSGTAGGKNFFMSERTSVESRGYLTDYTDG